MYRQEDKCININVTIFFFKSLLILSCTGTQEQNYTGTGGTDAITRSLTSTIGSTKFRDLRLMLNCYNDVMECCGDVTICCGDVTKCCGDVTICFTLYSSSIISILVPVSVRPLRISLCFSVIHLFSNYPQ